METKQQLKKEYGKWTVKEMEAKKRLDVLLPSVNLSEGVEMPSYNIIELLSKYDEVLEAEKEMKTASAKCREILKKLNQLQQ